MGRIVMTDPVCTHLDEAREVTPGANGCQDCLATGGRWLHLRLCMVCGHVGCCDNSPHRHATAHYGSSRHPLIQSFEPDEDWWWCYPDRVAFEVDGAQSYAHR
jgi:uncharacterized UBP type Zn finger protein